MIRRTLIVAAALAGLWATPAHASTWCGTSSPTDRTPNATAGNPVHEVYAIPSDGQDRLGQFGTVMQTDAEQIDAWWRGQDPTRTPRFDLFAFSCGLQLDISSVRLPVSGAQAADVQRAFQTIAQSLFNAGFGSPYVKNVVYYDGPLSDPDVCGVGGGDPLSGPSFAIVFVQACTGVSTAWVATHELVHSLGAVPSGAPHRCPDSGHVCDVTSDLMYPFAQDGVPLAQALLDPGRDDYYGHSGTWWDVQDSKWLIDLDAQIPLTVTVSGPGTVASDVPGVFCTASCTANWNKGTTVTLTPTAAQGMRFAGWSGGGCTGTGSCTLTLAQATSVSAQFGPNAFRLSLAVAGKGAVRANPIGLVCVNRCATSATANEPITLTAKAAPHWRFKGWTGACAGKKAVCSVPMTADSSAKAVFVKKKK